LFNKRRRVDPAELDALRRSLTEVQEALQASEAERATLRLHLEELRDRPQPPAEDHEVRGRVDALTTSLTAIDTLRERIDALQADVIGRADELSGRTDELTGRTEELTSRTEDLTGRIDQISEVRESTTDLQQRLEAVEQRMTSIGTELTNQIDELSGDIDALASLPSNAPTSPAITGDDAALLGQLRDSQTRLANEQARYQIAFREDLAKLAEQIRSNTPRR